MARPTIITDGLITEFCSKLRVSGSIETAIKTTGIGRESYYGWARKVREGKANGQQKKFIRAVEQAEAEAKQFREILLQSHFKKNWQALAWWLERKYSHEYGQRRPMPLPDPDAELVEKKPDHIFWRERPAPAPIAHETPPDEDSKPQ
jgi:hypothetical protein